MSCFSSCNIFSWRMYFLTQMLLANRQNLLWCYSKPVQFWLSGLQFRPLRCPLVNAEAYIIRNTWDPTACSPLPLLPPPPRPWIMTQSQAKGITAKWHTTMNVNIYYKIHIFLVKKKRMQGKAQSHVRII